MSPEVAQRFASNTLLVGSRRARRVPGSSTGPRTASGTSSPSTWAARRSTSRSSGTACRASRPTASIGNDRIASPILDIHTIGAGGGSIARVGYRRAARSRPGECRRGTGSRVLRSRRHETDRHRRRSRARLHRLRRVPRRQAEARRRCGDARHRGTRRQACIDERGEGGRRHLPGHQRQHGRRAQCRVGAARLRSARIRADRRRRRRPDSCGADRARPRDPARADSTRVVRVLRGRDADLRPQARLRAHLRPRPRQGRRAGGHPALQGDDRRRRSRRSAEGVAKSKARASATRRPALRRPVQRSRGARRLGKRHDPQGGPRAAGRPVPRPPRRPVRVLDEGDAGRAHQPARDRAWPDAEAEVRALQRRPASRSRRRGSARRKAWFDGAFREVAGVRRAGAAEWAYDTRAGDHVAADDDDRRAPGLRSQVRRVQQFPDVPQGREAQGADQAAIAVEG